MNFEDSNSSLNESVPVTFSNGATAKIQVSHTGIENVNFNVQSFGKVTEAIEGIAEEMSKTLRKISPSKASVTFGLEVQLEQGSLVAAIVQGKSTANLEVTLEWGK